MHIKIMIKNVFENILLKKMTKDKQNIMDCLVTGKNPSSVKIIIVGMCVWGMNTGYIKKVRLGYCGGSEKYSKLEGSYKGMVDA